MSTPTISIILVLWFTAVLLAVAFERLLGVLRTGRTAPYAAGIVVGLMIGPSFGPSLWPGLHDRFFAIPEATDVSGLIQSIEAATQDVQALKAADVSPAAIQEVESTRLSNEAALDRYFAIRIFGGLFTAFLVGYAIPVRTIGRDAWRPGAFVAAWTLVTVTGVMGAIAVFFFEATAMSGVCVGLAFAIPGLGATLAFLGHDVGGQDMERYGDRVVDGMMIVGWCLGLAVMATIMVWPGEAASASSKPWASWIVGLGLVVGILVAGHARSIAPTPTWIARSTTAAIVAILVAQVNVFQGEMIAAILLGGIIGGDARWIGVATGMRLVSIPWNPAWTTSIKVTDASAIQLGVGGLLWMTGYLSDVMLVAIIAGATICEATVMLRPWAIEMVRATNEHDD